LQLAAGNFKKDPPMAVCIAFGTFACMNRGTPAFCGDNNEILFNPEKDISAFPILKGDRERVHQTV